MSMCRLSDIDRPSSLSSKFTRDSSNASSSSSVTPPAELPDELRVERVKGSIFHSLMVASCDPEAKIRASPARSGTLNARLLTQSSWPGKTVAETNYNTCEG